MDPAAMRPFGLALLDYFNGNGEATITIYSDNGYASSLEVGTFFRDSREFRIDSTALDRCKGRVLDVGAGTGLHALDLQERGFAVCGVDVSPEACEIMRKRGLREVVCADIAGFEAPPYDTVLILGRGIGMVGDIQGLDAFLADIHRLVSADGQVLLNSVDVRGPGRKGQEGRYIGENHISFEYGEVRGPECRWVHLDTETLAAHASANGWACEVLLREDGGDYLAMLTRAKK